jgi:predicted nuclease of restriction endonuclease-like RecB superfamily
MNSMYAQRGMSYWGVMSLILVAVMFFKIAIIAVPAYMDDRLINESVEERLRSTSNSTQASQLYADLGQQFNLNNLRDISPKDIMTVTNIDGLQVIKNYEIRKNLIANMDLVLHFEKTFDQRAIKSGSGS